MNQLVTLTHPDLPGQPIRIDRRRIGQRLAAGWEEAQDAPVEEPTEPKRPRRKSTEEQ